MKAAVIHKPGDIPHYEDFPDPVPMKENEIVISVKAASIKNLDRYRGAAFQGGIFRKPVIEE